MLSNCHVMSTPKYSSATEVDLSTQATRLDSAPGMTEFTLEYCVPGYVLE
jgi:hypothetical protein